MISIDTDTRKIVSTLKNMIYIKEEFLIFDVLNNSTISIEYIASQGNYNYQVDYFKFLMEVEVNHYSRYTKEHDLEVMQDMIKESLDLILKDENQTISIVVIKPLIKYYLNWNLINEYENIIDFIKDIETIREILIDTATGGKRIEQVNTEYIALYNKIDEVFCKLDLENPNPFKNLWESYIYWSANLDGYAKRRVYYSNLYEEIFKLIKTTNTNDVINIQLEYTNWDKINRTIVDIKKQYNEANTVAQFNAIGAMCRSVYDFLADVIYRNEYHTNTTTPLPNDNQYKNKLLEFVLFRLDSKTNKDFRSHCKNMLDLADELTHKKTATKQQAALTINAVISIINIVSILNENTKSEIEDDEIFDDPLKNNLPF